jgi:flavin-dependent dehydrogenase
VSDDADVLIVGAGPAGSATAALLAEAGWSVKILERAVFPRPKPCGECLNPGAVAALRRIGMLAPVLALDPAKIDGWMVGSGEAQARGDFSVAAGPGLGVPRDRLDAALLGAARSSGASAEEGVTVRGVGEPTPLGRALSVRERDGSPGARRARIIVGADGLRSVTARAVGALRRSPRLRKLSLTARLRGRIALTRRGLLRITDGTTVGLAPVDALKALWNLTVVVHSSRAGRAAAGAPLAFMLEKAARSNLQWLEGPEVVAGPWASGPFDWPTRAVVADGLLLVGDAAGYYDPLTGQGIHQALRSAELAAEAIDSALRTGRVSEALGWYARRHRATFAPARLVQRAIEHVVSRAALRGALLERLAARPFAFDALLAVTGDSSPVRSLLRPRVVSALLLPAPRR